MEDAARALPPTKGDSDAAAALGGDTTHTALRSASSVGQLISTLVLAFTVGSLTSQMVAPQ
jgi:hypothetical protein